MIRPYTNLNLESLSAEQLLTAENFSAVKEKAYTYIDNLDWDGAVEFVNALEQRLNRFKPQTEEQEKRYEILRYWVLRLKLFSLPSLADTEIKALLQTSALEMVRNSLDLKSYLNRYIRFFKSDNAIQQEAKNLVFALTNNEEMLGSNRDQFRTLNFIPGVRNWIVQFQSLVNTKKASTGLKDFRAGALEISSFFNNNQFVRHLTAEEKADLLSIIECYSWLQNLSSTSSVVAPSSPGEYRFTPGEKRIGVVPGTPLEGQEEKPVGTPSLGRTIPPPFRPAPASQPVTPSYRGGERGPMTIAAMAQGQGKNMESGILNMENSQTPKPETKMQSPSPHSTFNIPPSKKTLPPPPRPPKFAAQNLGGQAPQTSPSSPPIVPRSGFSINDALARAGEKDQASLTGDLPKKP